MQAAGANVEHAGIAFPHDTPDHVWLAECGRRGWLVLMRDQHVRRRPLELDSLTGARVGAFVITLGQATADDVAGCVVPLLAKMAQIGVSEPRPFLFAVGQGRRLVRIKVRSPQG
jgi:hypothetical protein